jgi:very-short-patch-repair endonuclease
MALRNFKRGGLHFRRQAPIGRYIVDFVCHRAKLIVELDGSQHGSDRAMAYDETRTVFLNSRGYRVIRFPNVAIFENLHGVCDAIFAIAKEGPPTRSGSVDPSPDRPSRVGGGEN